ncbi:XdhC family protein [Aeribacillus sp. FSL M8-0235]|uniref:XdhC family protein n=1 Tax=Aeribacillus sp. FSL M8-0235 TaxID=2954576 RepID=UPI0030F709D3
MDYIHEILKIATTEPKKAVLATIIDVEGSAYRKEGAAMLIQEDGETIGVISGGCLENDLQERAKLLLEGESQCIVYDLKSEDDLSWGKGAGCNGVIRILLECIDDRLRKHLSRLHDLLQNGKDVFILKQLGKNFSVSNYLFFTEDTETFGEWAGAVPKQIDAIAAQEKSGLVWVNELSSYVYVQRFEPKPRLIIFGAGSDAVPLSHFASRTGFSVIVSDWREALCNRWRFPDADQLIIAFPREAATKIYFSPRDFVVLLTHQFQQDQELLKLLLQQNLRYIGVIGSKERTKRLLGDQEIPPHVHSPVGLSIGAEGPEEIAISILAELIQLTKLRSPQKVRA